MEEPETTRQAHRLTEEEDEALVRAGELASKEEAMRQIEGGDDQLSDQLLFELENEDEEDREIAKWFDEMSTADVPLIVANSESSDDECFPYRRTIPRHGAWHGASTMSRVPV